MLFIFQIKDGKFMDELNRYLEFISESLERMNMQVFDKSED